MGVCYHLTSRVFQGAPSLPIFAPGLMTQGLIKANFPLSATSKQGQPAVALILRQLPCITFKRSHTRQFNKRWTANVSHPGASQSANQPLSKSAGSAVKPDLCFVSQSQTSNKLCNGWITRLAQPKEAIKDTEEKFKNHKLNNNCLLQLKCCQLLNHISSRRSRLNV